MGWLKDWRARWRKRRLRERCWRAWKRENPTATRGAFYAVHVRQRQRLTGVGARTVGLDIDESNRGPRSAEIREILQAAGLRAEHRVVDYGCGSLWVGEELMRFLEPGNYIGLDVTDDFYTERLPLLPAGLVAERRPTLAVISPAALAAARRREPDVVLVTAVMLHVFPEERAAFLANLASMAGPRTRVLVQHGRYRRTRRRGALAWRHGAADIDRDLAPLGYRARWPGPDEPLARLSLFAFQPLSAP